MEGITSGLNKVMYFLRRLPHQESIWFDTQSPHDLIHDIHSAQHETVRFHSRLFRHKVAVPTYSSQAKVPDLGKSNA